MLRLKSPGLGTSLVGQWLRICLPKPGMQEPLEQDGERIASAFPNGHLALKSQASGAERNWTKCAE